MKHIKLFEEFSEENMLYERNAYKWTPEKIRQAIKDGGYSSRGDLYTKNSKLYDATLRYKMLDEFFDYYKWTPEKIRQAIKDGGYVSRNDLQNKNQNLYQAARRNKILDEFFDASKWTPEKIRKAIEDGGYESRIDLQNKNQNLYQVARKYEILDEFFDKYTPPKMRSEKTEWTAEKIREEIKKGNYKSKSDLKERNKKLYTAAWRYGVLYEFFEEPESFPTRWTPEKIRKAIEEGGYVSRNDLREKNWALYQAANNRNMFDEFFGKKEKK